MKIIRASHLGMCFGVRDAISLAIEQARSGPLTILGELVHNPSVLEDLRARGIRIVRDPAQAGSSPVMITAHGTSDRMLQTLRADGRPVLEATCPLVHFAHRAVKRLVAEGFHPVIVGQRDHVEVRGLTGDLPTFDVILADEDVERLGAHPLFGLAAQTTQPLERLNHLAELVAQRFPNSEVRVVDTICQPTKQRQVAARELARAADVVIVVGGANSNNTRELAATCARFCPRVHQVQSAAELRPEWFAGAGAVGLTAGTSTPEWLIEQVAAALAAQASSASSN